MNIWEIFRYGLFLCIENVFQSKTRVITSEKWTRWLLLKSEKQQAADWARKLRNFLQAEHVLAQQNIFLRNVLFKHGSFINFLCCICCCFPMASFSVKIYNSFFLPSFHFMFADFFALSMLNVRMRVHSERYVRKKKTIPKTKTSIHKQS